MEEEGETGETAEEKELGRGLEILLPKNFFSLFLFFQSWSRAGSNLRAGIPSSDRGTDRPTDGGGDKNPTFPLLLPLPPYTAVFMTSGQKEKKKKGERPTDRDIVVVLASRTGFHQRNAVIL